MVSFRRPFLCLSKCFSPLQLVFHWTTGVISVSLFSGSSFSPLCRLALKGAGVGPVTKHHAPLLPSHLEMVIADLQSCSDSRPHLAVLLAFGGCLRLGEVAALGVEDCIRTTAEQLELKIRRSKTDQVGEGASVFICLRSSPVLRDLLGRHSGGRTVGPLLCRTNTVVGISAKYCGKLVKGLFSRLGIDCSGHGCRAGSAMAQLESGREIHEVKRAGRWRSDGGLESYVSRTAATMGGPFFSA